MYSAMLDPGPHGYSTGRGPGDIGLQNGYRFTRAFKLGLFAPAPH